MSPSDSIPGWGGGLLEVADPSRRGIAERLSEAFRLYRANVGVLVRITTLTAGVLGVPLAILTAAQFRSVLDLLSGMFSGRLYDPTTTTFSSWSGPFHDPGMDFATLGLASGLSMVGSAIGISAVVRVILTPSVAERGAVALFREIRPRNAMLIGVGALIVIGYVLAFWLQGTWLGGIGPFDPYDPAAAARVASATGAALAFSLVLICVEIGAVYAGVRWAVSIPAYVVLGRTPGGALGRSSMLTKGRRLSILGLFIVTGIIVSIATASLTYLPVGVAYLVGWGSALGAILPFLGIMVALLLTTPAVGIIVAILYRDLQTAGPKRVIDVPDAPAGWAARED